MLVDKVLFVCVANKIYLRALPEALPASTAESVCGCNVSAECVCPEASCTCPYQPMLAIDFNLESPNIVSHSDKVLDTSPSGR